jgi:nitrate/TMAO reductase-like tetraheme cytochrome c subunit
MSKPDSDPRPDPSSLLDGIPGDSPGTPVRARPSRARRWLFRLGVALGVCLILGAIGLGSAEYYTSRPDFCGSCHVMDPYYLSWSRDVHGAKFGVKCIDCHYAPGERFTIKAKFKGLSQVASYFSGRYGAGRPRAHVADDSCLRSGCHGDLAFSSRTLSIGESRMASRLVGGRVVEAQRNPNVHFVHAKHLNADETRGQVEREIAETRERLRTGTALESFASIQKAATSVGPARNREASLQRLVADLDLSETMRKDAFGLMALEHRRIRIDQLAGLTCSACHTFDASMKGHLAADRQVCFTCHFANEEFNRNTGECMRCHEPPRRSVNVHADPTRAAQPVLMDHEDIIRRGVDCASCHLDVLRGEARVSERECVHCHDQAHFLDQFETRTTETVRKYHEIHVAQQRAHCFDCHRAIQHGLLDATPAATITAGFLEPVLNDCQHCHPNHHAEQVALLTGTGGADIAHPMPSAMTGSRLNCRACHTQAGEGSKGEAIVRATRQSCAACHSSDYMQMFDSWKHEIETYLSEAEARLAHVEKLIGERRAKGERRADRIEELLSGANQNIQLVRTGGGLHNRAYALQLLDTARLQLSDLERLLAPQP